MVTEWETKKAGEEVTLADTKETGGVQGESVLAQHYPPPRGMEA